MMKNKSILKRKLGEVAFVGSGAASGGITGIPLGAEVAAANMGEILTVEQMANPALVSLATDVIVGSSVAGGIATGLFSGLALLALYKTGKLKLSPERARKLKLMVKRLERKAERAGYRAEHWVGKEWHKLRSVV